MSAEDPTPFLAIKTKIANQEDMKQWADKKWVWIPDETDAYRPAHIVSENGDKTTVSTKDGDNITIDSDKVEKMNPPKFDKVVDMAELSNLNEASVLHNLRERYYSSLIYTYSGLFLVAINPYRKLPIYNEKAVQMYKGKKRSEMPPHIFALTDVAYQNMVTEKENQAILVTGESGAGKTENTKKVIQYLAAIAHHSTSGTGTDAIENLEESLIQANPVLEAFGNAKTIRNNNSSRFGKFIRVEFNPQGLIGGGNIETYLLEKSRVVYQTSKERNYHIFYQMFAGMNNEQRKKYLIEEDIKSYKFLAGSDLRADGIDDVQDFKDMLKGMDIMRFSDDDKDFIFRVLAGLLNFGNLKFSENRQEQAELDDTSSIDKVAFLLGLKTEELVKAILKPRVKAGREWVTQSKNAAQAAYSVEALSKATYERLFKWIVEKINTALDTKTRKISFMGILDIAGFEIFERNSYDQLLINYTNEKLQQFFNHHMFVLEQQEYERENIGWNQIDFGLDLQPTIDLIESQRGLGILALVDEQCFMPGGNDKGLLEKMDKTYKDRGEKQYSKPKFVRGGLQADFTVHHYAGNVDYNIDGFLDKNKDPLNENVVELLKKSNDANLSHIWKDYTTAFDETTARKGKSGTFRTLGQIHKEQLANLMKQLHSCQPHFVRCIIPNEQKKAGVIDPFLVLHQLRCNGVLEGIRICRQGFPNRIMFQEFRQRYEILTPGIIPEGFMDGKKAAELMLQNLDLDESQFRIGKTKVFFRAGVLADLEEQRDNALAKILANLQAYARGYLARRRFNMLRDQEKLVELLQRNMRKFLALRQWAWWRLFNKVKPLLSVARQEEEMRAKEQELEKLAEKARVEEELRRQLEEREAALLAEKQALFDELEQERAFGEQAAESLEKLKARYADLEEQYKALQERLEQEEDNNAEISAEKKKLELRVEELERAKEEMEESRKRLESEQGGRDSKIAELLAEINAKQDIIDRLQKEKAAQDEKIQELQTALQTAEDELNKVTRAKAKLEQAKAELDEQLEKEKAGRADAEKAKRALEAQVRELGGNLENLKSSGGEMEDQLRRKEEELSQATAEYEEQSAKVSSLERKIREMQSKIDELDEDLDAEKNQRESTERQRAELERQLQELNDRLDEAGGATAAAAEASKMKAEELIRAKSELERVRKEGEERLAASKKQMSAQIEELSGELEAANNARREAEKAKNALAAEKAEVGDSVETLRARIAELEKQLKKAQSDLAEAAARAEEYERRAVEAESALSSLQSENASLSSQLEDNQHQVGTLSKAKKTLEEEVTSYKEQLEEANAKKLEALSNAKKLELQLQNLESSDAEKSAEQEALAAQIEAAKKEAEEARRQATELNARLTEEDDRAKRLKRTIEEAHAESAEKEQKVKAAEASKRKIQQELEDAVLELEKVKADTSGMEKSKRKFDQQLQEWKQKVEEETLKTQDAQRQFSEAQAQAFSYKNQLEELEVELDRFKRENSNLKEEVEQLTESAGEGGKASHEVEMARRKAEMEAQELRSQVEELEGDLTLAEDGKMRVQVELNHLKVESERRLHDKDAQIEEIRKNFQRQIDSINESLETEVRRKNEAVSLKKKIELEMNELEIAVDNTQKQNGELQKQVKRLQQQINELRTEIEEEHKSKDGVRDEATKWERKFTEISNEIDGANASAAAAERSKKILQGELDEALANLEAERASKTAGIEQKARYESEISTLKAEMEELEMERQEALNKAKRAQEELERFKSEQDSEQEEREELERQKIALERKVRDLTTKNEELENSGVRGAKTKITKLENEIASLNLEVENERRCNADYQKTARSAERRAKDLQFSLDEEKRRTLNEKEQTEKYKEKVKSLQSAQDDIEESNMSIQKRNRTLVREVEELEEKITALEQENQDIKSRLRAEAAA
eukprot:Clim_evm66s191 gene=Clim_evmTU66s191